MTVLAEIIIIVLWLPVRRREGSLQARQISDFHEKNKRKTKTFGRCQVLLFLGFVSEWFYDTHGLVLVFGGGIWKCAWLCLFVCSSLLHTPAY